MPDDELNPLLAHKLGESHAHACVCIREGLLPHLIDTKRIELAGGFATGFNSGGNRTMRVLPHEMKVGWILANRKGMRSMRIASIAKI
jgi:hypothetical protein